MATCTIVIGRYGWQAVCGYYREAFSWIAIRQNVFEWCRGRELAERHLPTPQRTRFTLQRTHHYYVKLRRFIAASVVSVTSVLYVQYPLKSYIFYLYCLFLSGIFLIT